MLEMLPDDPARDEYRHDNMTRPAYRHGRGSKIARCFQLFFHYDPTAKMFVYAGVNDEQTLRSSRSKYDRYAAFEKMPGRGRPPDDLAALRAASRADRIKQE